MQLEDGMLLPKHMRKNMVGVHQMEVNIQINKSLFKQQLILEQHLEHYLEDPLLLILEDGKLS
jgi:hypothetical protein